MTAIVKFKECTGCQNFKKANVCADCDAGEQYEEVEIDALDFDTRNYEGEYNDD